MSFRTAYGHTHSENGWRMVNRDACVVTNPVPFSDTAPVRAGDAATILNAWLIYYHRHVEPITSPVWGWSAANDVRNSNHLSGTAVDINAPKYPWGLLRMPAGVRAEVEKGLELFEGTIFWGRRWSKPDEMHYQLGFPEGDGRIAAFAAKLNSGHIGIYAPPLSSSPPSVSGLSAETLREAMGSVLPIDRYRVLLPAVVESMIACGATDLNAAAMWLAQIGHESGGLRWMEEIWGPTAAQTRYEGRADLGNTFSGDGSRFRGRGPIQITGRTNYVALSKWAHSRGLVPTPTFFVDQPAQLASDKYGFLGVTWYWLLARGERIRTAARAGNVEEVTRLINGGANGLADRQTRYARARAMGARIIPTHGGLTMSDIQTILAKLDSIDKRLERVEHQLGPKLTAWPDTSSMGTTPDGTELTLRDGLAETKRDVTQIRRDVAALAKDAK